ncbi:MAG: cell division protein SepF [Acidimicrobiales bacterium]
MSGISQTVRNLKNIWGHGDEEDDYRDDEIEDTQPAPSHTETTSTTPSYGGGSGSNGSYNPRKPRLVASPLRAGREKNIYTLKPKSQEDAAIAADYLKTGTAVIINLEDVERSHAIRIIDFMSGVCYGLENQGHAMKLGDTIFLYTPGDFEISSDETDYAENPAPFFREVQARRDAAQQQQNTPQNQQAPQQPQQVQQPQAQTMPQQGISIQPKSAPPNPYAPTPRRPTAIPDAPSQHASSSQPERRPWDR